MPLLFFLHGYVALESGVVFSGIKTIASNNLPQIRSPYGLKYMG